MKLLTDIRICLISCPGVRLSCYKSKVYIRIKMFDCLAISSKLKPKFPLFFFEHFYFEKQFKCQTILELFKSLSDEFIEIELINENNLILSKYESNALIFLYPRPQLRPKYSQTCRSLLMDYIVLSLSPKLEFQTNSTIMDDKDYCHSEEEFDSSILGSIEL